MLGGRGRTKRAVGSMRGLKVPKRGLARLRATKALKGAIKTAKAVKAPARRAAGRVSGQLGAVASRGGRPTPRRRSPFRRRASAQQRGSFGAAIGRARVQARRR